MSKAQHEPTVQSGGGGAWCSCRLSTWTEQATMASCAEGIGCHSLELRASVSCVAPRAAEDALQKAVFTLKHTMSRSEGWPLKHVIQNGYWIMTWCRRDWRYT